MTAPFPADDAVPSTQSARDIRLDAIDRAHAALHSFIDGVPCSDHHTGECHRFLTARIAVNEVADAYNAATRLEGNELARQCADLRDELDTVRIGVVRFLLARDCGDGCSSAAASAFGLDINEIAEVPA